MDLVNSVLLHAQAHPDRPCFTWREHTLTYGELELQSRRVAGHLDSRLGRDTSPIVVFGHKHPLIAVSFLGAARSGRAYIPVDSSFPVDRVNSIVSEAGASLGLAAGTDIPAGVTGTHIDLQALQGWARTDPPRPIDSPAGVSLESPFYIIFTSGSTGRPKGVQISRDSLNRFAEWGLTLVRATLDDPGLAPAVFLNQAPFSFDLSVMDLAIGLASGSSLVSVDRDHVARLADLFDMLAKSRVNVWVSTPSFADLCLSDQGFNRELLPEVREFLFCGETLSVTTASELSRRFPQARVVNTYGPTESTVAVTSIVVDEEVLREHAALPVGAAKPGTSIFIWDEEGNSVPDGERGEIVIAGDTVSLGYFGRPDLNEKAFGMISGPHGPWRFYRTGDAGVLRGGVLHFLGRLDFQVKLHGYRIEVEDIEANLQRLPGVRRAVVFPVDKIGQPGVYTHLEAVLQADRDVDTSLATMVRLKRQLKEFVPEYMVPKILHIVRELPMTANGKADRRAARALVS